MTTDELQRQGNSRAPYETLINEALHEDAQ
jgi:hypothetical protein